MVKDTIRYSDINILKIIYLKSILYYNNYLEDMLKYKLEKKLVQDIYCEVCGSSDSSKTTNSEIIVKSIKEFHKNGTSKIHYTCSKHLVDLYKKLSK